MKVTHKLLKQEFQVSEILIEVTPSSMQGRITVIGVVPTKFCSICKDRNMEESSICTIPVFTLDDIEESFTFHKEERTK